jgi:hypothetical protein
VVARAAEFPDGLRIEAETEDGRLYALPAAATRPRGP